MNGQVHLVLGGSRSGKSSYALKLAESLGDPAATGGRAFIATAPVLDSEMNERIENHKREREGRGWTTIEEQTSLVHVMERSKYSVLLIDCLTLWINNLMYIASVTGQDQETPRTSGTGLELTEDDIASSSLDLVRACQRSSAAGRHIVLVSNEVGLGIVPENKLARRFRDLAGRCNQIVASEADNVYFMVSGIPLRVK